MKKIILLLLIIISPLTIHADEQVDRETVEQLIELTNVKSMIDAMNTEIDKMLNGLSVQLEVNEEEQYIFDNYLKEVNASVRQEITWEKMEESIIRIYMKHYTKKEIEEILAFYKTETGRSLINKMPIVMQESMQISQNMFTNIMPKIQKLAQKLQNELIKRRQDKLLESVLEKESK